MSPPPAKSSYAGHRFPAEVIGQAVWLYSRFPLSLRMVEEMLAPRGIVVSHETVRRWALKFGQAFANRIRRRLPRAGDKWHLDEVAIKIAGVEHWLWRAVDQTGVVLDVLVQSRRDKRAAKRLLRKLLKKQMRPPRVMVADKLASYGAAKKELMPGVEHRRHKGLNNRAENSHQPTLAEVWRRIGLRGVREADLTIRMDFAEFWEPMAEGNTFGTMLRGLPAERRDLIRDRAEAAYRSGEPDGPRSFAATAWAVAGMR
jgi:putative transposase